MEAKSEYSHSPPPQSKESSLDTNNHSNHSSSSENSDDDFLDSIQEMSIDDKNALIEQLFVKNKKLENKMTEVLGSVKEFQQQQKKLFHKYTDLKHDHADLLESTKKFLWEDIFSPEFGYNFMALKPREQGLDESEKKVGDLELQEILGEGQFAEVRACYCTTTQTDLAVKIIEKRKVKTFDSLKRIDNEIDVLQDVSGCHPGILKLLEVHHGKKFLYMVTEKLDMDLFDFYDDHPNGVTEELGRLIITGIMRGVEFCHKKGIAHRDLKPENILLRRIEIGEDECLYDVVLCDFGLCARVQPGEMLTDFCGSPGFFAPEMFVNGSYDGFQADVWSIGCILLELLVGHDTFGECWMTAYDSEYMKDKTDFRNEISDAVNELKELTLPEKLSGFLQELLSDVDGVERPSVWELLRHDWITEVMGNNKLQRRLSNKSSPSLERNFSRDYSAQTINSV